jgi:hypothetical protein
MTLTGDERMWHDAGRQELHDIAKRWADKFSLGELVAFQSQYLDLETRKGISDEEWQSIDNRWKVATMAIEIREFGE